MIEFHPPGPPEGPGGGIPGPVRAAQQRAGVAVLLLRHGATVSGQRLIDELWGENPPVSARKVVQTYVSKLRHLLPADVLVTRATGYALRVDPDVIDAAC